MPNIRRMQMSAAGAGGAWDVLSGTLWTWGGDGSGALGHGTKEVTKSVPTQVGSDTDWVCAGHGSSTTTAIKSDGTLWTWGDSMEGQLGDGTATGESSNDRSSPVQVGTDTNWGSPGDHQDMTISLYNHAMILKQDGTLWTCGRDHYGACAINSGDTTISIITQVGSATDWLYVTVGVWTTWAIKQDGTLWAWGKNHKGQNGQGDSDTTGRSAPVQIGSATNWTWIANTYNTLMAFNAAGELWVVGDAASGETAQGNILPLSTLTQVGSLTNWLKGDGGGELFHAIKTDGTRWSWGNGYRGQLGLGAPLEAAGHRSSPCQVGSETDWFDMGGSTSSDAFGIRGSGGTGTLWTCGDNAAYQGGTGNNTRTSYPTQAGSDTDWTRIYKGHQYCELAIKHSL